MSQSKFNKITIRNREDAEGQITFGNNTQVLLDGIPIRGCQFFKFEVHVGKPAKVMIEMIAEVELDINAELEKNEKESTELLNIKGKPINLYSLSNYCPILKAYKK